MVQSTHGSKGSKTKKEKFIFGQKQRDLIEIRGLVFSSALCVEVRCFVCLILMRMANLLRSYRRSYFIIPSR